MKEKELISELVKELNTYRLNNEELEKQEIWWEIEASIILNVIGFCMQVLKFAAEKCNSKLYGIASDVMFRYLDRARELGREIEGIKALKNGGPNNV